MKLHNQILQIQEIFQNIKAAIKKKGVDIEECEGPEVYAQKILEINTCDHEQPPIEDLESEIELDVEQITMDFDKDLIKTINVTYKYYDQINDPVIELISKNSNWLTISNSGINGNTYTYTITAEKNNGLERSAGIKFSCEKNNKTKEVLVIITQKAFTEDIPDIPDVPVEEPTIHCDISEFNVDYNACITDTFEISANDTINYSTENDWVSVNENGSVYSISIEENTLTSSRSAEIEFSCTKGSKTATHIITVNQTGKPGSELEELYIKTNRASSAIGSEAQDFNITIETNANEWSITSEFPDWIEFIGIQGNEVLLHITENTDINSSRRHQITFKGTRGNESKNCYVDIIQNARKPILADITLTFTEYNFDENENTQRFYVLTRNTISVDNQNYEFWVKEKSEWIGVEITDETSKPTSYLHRTTKVSVSANDGPKRTGTVVFACMGEGNIEYTVTLTITQDGKSSPMYYGYIPTQLIIDHGLNKTDNWFENVTEECILEAVELGTITKVDQATTMGKTSFGVVPEDTMLLIAVPSDSGLVATMDDGDNAKVKFDSTTPNSNGENTVTIDGIAYDLYGQYAPIDYPAESKFFYID